LPEGLGCLGLPYKEARSIHVGSVRLGGGAPIAVQTMTATDTRDVGATLAQIQRCAALGAEIVRVAAPNAKAAAALKEIVSRSPVPIVADVHFDHRLALAAIDAGAAGVRINPGNIGGAEKTRKVAEACGKAGAALRVGVNMGSLDKELALRFGRTPQAMAMSALKDLAIVEETGFKNYKVSLKASSPMDTVKAARIFAQMSDAPQHLGVTEAGGLIAGISKSAVALGLLLSDGIGATIRVSLTAPPEEEVLAAYEILRALGLRNAGVEYISCPTCGRCEIDLIKLLEDVKNRLSGIRTPLKVAVMGCKVNGPGEAREADLGVAGGKDGGRIFIKGESFEDCPYGKLAERLEEIAKRMAREMEKKGD
jgi:(E)-4-hydroxy-3-methylbut-2-enyl-diphosphate synthase